MSTTSEIPEGLVTTYEAARILNRSIEAIRQYTYRGVLPAHRIGRRVYIHMDDILKHHPKKKNLPAYTDLPAEVKESEGFLTEPFVAGTLQYTMQYVRSLVKSGTLKACCTVDGQILIFKSSFDEFMGVMNDANSL